MKLVLVAVFCLIAAANAAADKHQTGDLSMNFEDDEFAEEGSKGSYTWGRPCNAFTQRHCQETTQYQSPYSGEGGRGGATGTVANWCKGIAIKFESGEHRDLSEAEHKRLFECCPKQIGIHPEWYSDLANKVIPRVLVDERTRSVKDEYAFVLTECEKKGWVPKFQADDRALKSLLEVGSRTRQRALLSARTKSRGSAKQQWGWVVKEVSRWGAKTAVKEANKAVVKKGPPLKKHRRPVNQRIHDKVKRGKPGIS